MYDPEKNQVRVTTLEAAQYQDLLRQGLLRKKAWDIARLVKLYREEKPIPVGQFYELITSHENLLFKVFIAGMLSGIALATILFTLGYQNLAWTAVLIAIAFLCCYMLLIMAFSLIYKAIEEDLKDIRKTKPVSVDEILEDLAKLFEQQSEDAWHESQRLQLVVEDERERFRICNDLSVMIEEELKQA
jgi:hypothetical protein